MARMAGVFMQHLAQGGVAPGGFAATEKQTIGVAMLATRNRLLESRFAVLLHPVLQSRLVFRAGRPRWGNQ
jgi:hypothetical protein